MRIITDKAEKDALLQENRNAIENGACSMVFDADGGYCQRAIIDWQSRELLAYWRWGGKYDKNYE